MSSSIENYPTHHLVLGRFRGPRIIGIRSNRRISGHHQRGAGGANKRITRSGVGDHDLRCGGKYLRPRIEHQKFFERARGFAHP